MVHDGLPSELRGGIFREPKSYAALIRLSNSSASIKSDKQKDFRGFAIKLLGVQGDRVNQDKKQSQDFVLMSSPTMPLGTVKLFRDAIYYAIKWHPLVMLLKLIKVATIQIPIQRTNNAVRNDLVETMSYSPAHALAVHRPLGGLNIARTDIYKALSQFRHERNGKVALEPTQESFNSIE